MKCGVNEWSTSKEKALIQIFVVPVMETGAGSPERAKVFTGRGGETCGARSQGQFQKIILHFSRLASKYIIKAQVSYSFDKVDDIVGRHGLDEMPALKQHLIDNPCDRLGLLKLV